MLGQISPQPVFLRLCLRRSSGLEVKLAVQRDNVPPADIVAVIALAGRSGSRAEITEVRLAGTAVLVVIPRRGVNHSHDSRAPPRRREAPRKIIDDSLRSGGVSVVPESGDDRLDALRTVGEQQAVDQHARRLISRCAADCDVTRSDEHGRSRQNELLGRCSFRRRRSVLVARARARRQYERRQVTTQRLPVQSPSGVPNQKAKPRVVMKWCPGRLVNSTVRFFPGSSAPIHSPPPAAVCQPPGESPSR